MLMQHPTGMRPFDFDSYSDNVGSAWEKWKRGFDSYLNAAAVTEAHRKLALLMYFAGEKIRDIFPTLPELQVQYGPLASTCVPHQDEYEVAICKLDKHFLPLKNTIHDRYLFRNMKQEPSEIIESYVIRLRVQANRCDFGELLDENMRDQFIAGCNSISLRQRVLQKGMLKLEEIITMAKSMETAAEQEKAFRTAETKNIQPEAVNRIGTDKESKEKAAKNGHFAESGNIECGRCGRRGHRGSDDKCPAKGKKCFRCDGLNHFSKKCRSRGNDSNQRRGKFAKRSRNASVGHEQ